MQPSHSTETGIYLRDAVAPSLDRGTLGLSAALGLLYVVLRAWNLTGASLWADENFTLKAVREPWADMFTTLVADKVHPPLFYIALKLWVGVGGESLLWLKLFPFALSVFTLVPVLLLCREIRASRLALLLVLAQMAPNPFLIHYAQEVRMYSMVVLLTALSVWMFVRFINRPELRSGLWLLFAVDLALVLTHYFGWLIVGAEAAFLLASYRDRARRGVWAVVGMVLANLPWFWLVGSAAARETVPFHNLQWMTKPTVGGVWRLFCSLTGPRRSIFIDPFRAMVFLSPVVLWTLALRRDRDKDPERMLLRLLTLLTLGPPALVILISVFGPQSFWYPRQLIIIALPFIVLVAVAVSKVATTWVRRSLAAGVIAIAAAGAFTSHTEAGMARVAWGPVANEIASDKSNQNVYVLDTLSLLSLTFYLDEIRDSRHRVITVDSVSEIEDPAFWLIYAPGRFKADQPSPAEVLTLRGYWIESESVHGHGDGEMRLLRLSKQ